MKNLIVKETMSSIEIAELTGEQHKDVFEAIHTMESAWKEISRRKFPLVEYMDAQGKLQSYYQLNKSECLYVATKFNDEARAKLILRWETLEKIEIPQQSSLLSKAPTIHERIAAADWMAGFLNMNNCSKLQLAKTIAEPLGLPTPEYTQSQDQLLSATDLLKRVGSPLRVREFNIKMKEKDFLTELERSSRKGLKKFKSLTSAGIKYGENQVNPGNPKETQPLYYVNLFEKLLAELIV